MVRTEHKVDFYVNYRETCKNTALQGVLNTFVNSRNIFFRNYPACDRVDKFIAFSRIWFDFEHNMTVLTASAGLFCIFGIGFALFRDGFTVSNLRFADIRLHVEFAKQTVNNDFKVEFTHTGNNGLSCFLIAFYTE